MEIKVGRGQCVCAHVCACACAHASNCTILYDVIARALLPGCLHRLCHLGTCSIVANIDACNHLHAKCNKLVRRLSANYNYFCLWL